MRILHINNLSIGSITNHVVIPLMEKLNHIGYQNDFFSPDKLSNGSFSDKFIYRIIRVKLLFEKITRKLISNNDYYFYNIFESIALITPNRILKENPIPDVIILYWFSGIINSKTILKIQKESNARIFIFPMDMAILSGGCHYFWDCNKYQNNCNQCPALKTSFKFIAKNNLKFKKQHYSHTKVEFLAPTNTIVKQLKSSILFRNNKIWYFPIGVNENYYITPLNSFNKLTPKKVLIGASSIKDRRKGMDLLLRALNGIYETSNDNKNIELVVIGNDANGFFDNIEIPKTFLGFVDQDKLIDSFQNAYCLICPSIEDAGPMMINQSLMCGTPVVAFKIGVAIDIVLPGETGFLAENKTSDSLIVAMIKMLSLSNDSYNKMRENCRFLAKNTFGLLEVSNRLDKILKLKQKNSIIN